MLPGIQRVWKVNAPSEFMGGGWVGEALGNPSKKFLIGEPPAEIGPIMA